MPGDGCVAPGPRPALLLQPGGWNSNAVTVFLRHVEFDFRSCTIDSELDIAVCNTSQDVSPLTKQGYAIASATLADEPVAVGTLAAFIGFPKTDSLPVTSCGSVAAYRTIKTSARANVYIDHPAWPGSSGGPVFLIDGRVIGMITGYGFGDSAGLSSAVAARYIQATYARKRLR